MKQKIIEDLKMAGICKLRGWFGGNDTKLFNIEKFDYREVNKIELNQDPDDPDIWIEELIDGVFAHKTSNNVLWAEYTFEILYLKES